MMRFGGIWRANATAPKASPEALGRIKDMTREILALDGDATISANEIICADPACPGSETVVLVMRPGHRTKAYKVQGEAAAVTRAALEAALTPPAS